MAQFVFVKSQGFFISIYGRNRLARWGLYGRDLVAKAAFCVGAKCFLIAVDGVRILVVARESVAFCTPVAASAHVQVVVHIPQAVANDGVHEFTGSKPVTRACVFEQIGCAAHVFRAAREDQVRVSALDGLRREHHGFEARPAHLVDRCRAHRSVDSRAYRHLAGDVLA